MRGSSEMRALFTFEQMFSDSCEWWLLFTLCQWFTMWTPHSTWFTYHWFTYHTGSLTTLVHIPHGSHTTGVRFPPWAVEPTHSPEQSIKILHTWHFFSENLNKNKAHKPTSCSWRKVKMSQNLRVSALMKGVMVVDAFSVQSFDRWE